MLADFKNSFKEVSCTEFRRQLKTFMLQTDCGASWLFLLLRLINTLTYLLICLQHLASRYTVVSLQGLLRFTGLKVLSNEYISQLKVHGSGRNDILSLKTLSHCTDTQLQLDRMEDRSYFRSFFPLCFVTKRTADVRLVTRLTSASVVDSKVRVY